MGKVTERAKESPFLLWQRCRFILRLFYLHHTGCACYTMVLSGSDLGIEFNKHRFGLARSQKFFLRGGGVFQCRAITNFQHAQKCTIFLYL